MGGEEKVEKVVEKARGGGKTGTRKARARANNNRNGGKSWEMAEKPDRHGDMAMAKMAKGRRRWHGRRGSGEMPGVKALQGKANKQSEQTTAASAQMAPRPLLHCYPFFPFLSGILFVVVATKPKSSKERRRK